MTNGELVPRFIRHYGGRPAKTIEDITPIAPYILMDVAYQSYRKHIAPLKVTGMAKQLRNRWSKAYHLFNMQVFLPFNDEERDSVVDRMDAIEEYLSDEVKALEDAIIRFLDGKIVYDREVIASVLLNNILAQASNELIFIAAKGLTGQGARSRELDTIRVLCIKFANVYLPPEGDINTSDDPAVCDAVSALSHKIAKWIFEQ